MKSSEKDGAKDVNEPMKSRLTAVTAVAPAIKHGALAALKYTWGACSRACSTQAHTAVHEHTVLQLRGLNRGQEEGEQPLKGGGHREERGPGPQVQSTLQFISSPGHVWSTDTALTLCPS